MVEKIKGAVKEEEKDTFILLGKLSQFQKVISLEALTNSQKFFFFLGGGAGEGGGGQK